MNDVRRQLIVNERNGQIIKWYDGKIPPGSEWRNQIDSRLQAAHVILLFMSPHFIKSKYCYEVEGKAALLRHQSGGAHVIPIILRPCAWEQTPFGSLQALPKDAPPISRWVDRDEACLDTARGVMAVVDGLTKLLKPSSAVPNTSARHIKPEANEAQLIYCKRCGASPGSRSECTGNYTNHDFVAGIANTYCKRCGASPGSRSECTGNYTNHDFVAGIANTYCKRCGASPGSRSECTGNYTNHDFVAGIANTYCKRCGASPGSRSECTGNYTSHDFVAGIANTYCKRCGASPGSRSECTGNYTSS